MQAYIYGVNPITKAGYPGKASFAVFFAGCNFRCPFCCNAGYLDFKEEFLVDLKDIKKQMEDLSSGTNAVIFCGCEPTLQRQALLELASHAKKLGLAIGLETNGSRPDTIQSMLKENLLDFVALDIKAPFEEQIFEKVTKSSTYFKQAKEIMEELKQTIDILREDNKRVEVEIRTTVVPGIIYKRQDILGIAKMIGGADWRWKLQPFSPNLGEMPVKRMKGINSPTREFLINLKNYCQEYYPNLRIDVSD